MNSKHQLHFGYDFRTEEFFVKCSCGHARWAKTLKGIDIATKQHTIHNAVIERANSRNSLRSDRARS